MTKNGYLRLVFFLLFLVIASFITIVCLGIKVQDYPISDDMNGYRTIFENVGATSLYIFFISFLAIFVLGIVSLFKQNARSTWLFLAICSPIFLALALLGLS